MSEGPPFLGPLELVGDQGPVRATSACPAFVGRRAELDRLRDLLGGVAQGGASALVVVEAEAGFGKRTSARPSGP